MNPVRAASWLRTRSICATGCRKPIRLDLQISVHAIGDRANDIVLDTMAAVVAANGARDRRFRIEHAQHLTPSAIPRFAKQNVIASVQPYHAIDDGRWAINRIGPERLKTTYAFHSLVASGAHVCLGSDWPVAPLDPADRDCSPQRCARRWTGKIQTAGILNNASPSLRRSPATRAAAHMQGFTERKARSDRAGLSG